MNGLVHSRKADVDIIQYFHLLQCMNENECCKCSRRTTNQKQKQMECKQNLQLNGACYRINASSFNWPAACFLRVLAYGCLSYFEVLVTLIHSWEWDKSQGIRRTGSFDFAQGHAIPILLFPSELDFLLRGTSRKWVLVILKSTGMLNQSLRRVGRSGSRSA